MTNNEPDQQPGESVDLTEENGCPPGYIWDSRKQICVPIIIDEEED